MDQPHSKLFDVAGKTAIVTGASSGLGVTFAEARSAGGASVVVAARREDRLAGLVEGLNGAGGSALAVSCDVTDAEQVESLVETARNRFGRVDILVDNAGTAGDDQDVIDLFAAIIPDGLGTRITADSREPPESGRRGRSRAGAPHTPDEALRAGGTR